MVTYQVEILDPKATKLLEDLADLNIISIRKNSESFTNIVEKLRKNAEKKGGPTDEAILAEVESVRKKRHAVKKA